MFVENIIITVIKIVFCDRKPNCSTSIISFIASKSSKTLQCHSQQFWPILHLLCQLHLSLHLWTTLAPKVSSSLAPVGNYPSLILASVGDHPALTISQQPNLASSLASPTNALRWSESIQTIMLRNLVPRYSSFYGDPDCEQSSGIFVFSMQKYLPSPVYSSIQKKDGLFHFCGIRVIISITQIVLH